MSPAKCSPGRSSVSKRNSGSSHAYKPSGFGWPAQCGWRNFCKLWPGCGVAIPNDGRGLRLASSPGAALSAPPTAEDLLELAKLTLDQATRSRRALLLAEIRILKEIANLARAQNAAVADLSRRVAALEARGRDSDNVVAGPWSNPWMTGGGPAGGRA